MEHFQTKKKQRKTLKPLERRLSCLELVPFEIWAICENFAVDEKLAFLKICHLLFFNLTFFLNQAFLKF